MFIDSVFFSTKIKGVTMKIFLLILSVLAFVAGFGIVASANGAIHEIEGFVLFIVSAVLLSGSAIIGAIGSLNNQSNIVKTSDVKENN